MEHEQLIQMQVLEQEAEALNQQLQLIEQNLSEIKDLGLGIEEIGKKENKDILVNIGKKIYLPVEISDSNLLVEVGEGNFVRKTIPETREIIEEQTERLILGKEDVEKRLEELQEQANELMQIFIKESEKEEKEKKK